MRPEELFFYIPRPLFGSSCPAKEIPFLTVSLITPNPSLPPFPFPIFSLSFSLPPYVLPLPERKSVSDITDLARSIRTRSQKFHVYAPSERRE